MKQIIIGLAILLALSSCSQKRCWQCVYSSPYKVEKYEICEMTRKEIKEIEEAYSYGYMDGYNGDAYDKSDYYTQTYSNETKES